MSRNWTALVAGAQQQAIITNQRRLPNTRHPCRGITAVQELTDWHAHSMEPDWLALSRFSMLLTFATRTQISIRHKFTHWRSRTSRVVESSLNCMTPSCYSLYWVQYFLKMYRTRSDYYYIIVVTLTGVFPWFEIGEMRSIIVDLHWTKVSSSGAA